MKLIGLIYALLTLIENVLVMSHGRCIVKTEYGILEGRYMISRRGKEFCAYLGIPFASRPTGKLRFQPPISPQAWEGTRNATTEGKKCLQSRFKGSEDCLYLNVFAQNINESSIVMVYIHGGGFRVGSSSLKLLGPEYIMDREVVLVTLQYRLHVFGFLSTADEVIPGNMGMKDQVKALQWVQSNIEYFGGNPNQVTIFGNSAGGASVHLHMLSPLSQNLFVRAISQSGTALSSFAMISKEKSRNDTLHLAQSLNCSVQSSIQILECLQNKSSSDILHAYNQQLISKYGVTKLFRPVIEVLTEHAFLTTNPWKTKTKKPWLVGVNANEGNYQINLHCKINETIHLINSDFINFGPRLMFVNDLYLNIDEIINKTYNFYFKNLTASNEIMKRFEQLVSDSWFVWPTEQGVNNHNGILYYYLYDHEGENTYTKAAECPRALGVSHTDELLVLFTQKGIFGELNEPDSNISKLMTNLWVNFASIGNPTPNPIERNPQKENDEDFTWEASSKTDPVYLHIKTNHLSMERGMFSARMDFWRQVSLQYQQL